MSKIRATNEIYLAIWARDIYAFIEEQYELLSDIAEQNPIPGGPAVYTARVMLGVDYGDYREIKDGYLNYLKESFIHVYPNPAVSEVNIEYSSGENETGQFFSRKISIFTVRNFLYGFIRQRIDKAAINFRNLLRFTY